MRARHIRKPANSSMGLAGPDVCEEGREGCRAPGGKWDSERLSAKLSPFSPCILVVQMHGYYRILTCMLTHPKRSPQFRKSRPIMKMYTLLRGRLPSQTNFQVPITLISALDLAERTYQIPSASPHAAPGPFLSPGLSAPLLGGCCGSEYKC